MKKIDDDSQWFAWNEQSGCWVLAHLEFSKLFRCDDSIGARGHPSFKLLESGVENDSDVSSGGLEADDSLLFYRTPNADKISVALCLVGEARQSTFQEFNGLPPVSSKVAGLQ